MESLFQTFADNPVYLAIAVVLALVILFGVIKKLVKLALVVVAIFVLYIAYLVWTGQSVPTSFDDIQDSIQETVEKGKSRLRDAGDELQEKSKEAVKEKADKEVDKLMESAKEKLEKMGGEEF